MRFELLHYFRRVAQLESFTKAARELFIAQPALSKQIKRLEEELDTTLFERLGRGIRLTEAGKMLLVYSERILGEWWEVHEKIRALKQPEGGSLRLAIFPTTMRYVIRFFLAEFIKIHQAIDVEIEEQLTETIIEWVVGYQAEGGVVVYPVSNPRLRELPLYNEDFGLFVPRGHPWYNENVLPASDLYKHPIIIPTLNRKYYRDFVMSMLQQHKVQLEPRVVVHNYENTKQLARAGLGAALVPLVACQDLDETDEEVKVVRMSPPLRRRMVWIERNDRERSLACDEFYRLLVRYLHQTPALRPFVIAPPPK